MAGEDPGRGEQASSRNDKAATSAPQGMSECPAEHDRRGPHRIVSPHRTQSATLTLATPLPQVRTLMSGDIQQRVPRLASGGAYKWRPRSVHPQSAGSLGAPKQTVWVSDLKTLPELSLLLEHLQTEWGKTPKSREQKSTPWGLNDPMPLARPCLHRYARAAEGTCEPAPAVLLQQFPEDARARQPHGRTAVEHPSTRVLCAKSASESPICPLLP